MIRFDPERGICIVELSGRPTITDVRDEICALLDHPSHVDGMDEIWDLRDAALTGFTARDLQALAAFVAQNIDRVARRTALVVGRDVDYGIGRMWQAYAESPAPQQRCLFRNLEDAISWLTL